MPQLNDTDTRGTTTPPRPTTKPKQADPRVTAGEVQGQGEYPGIPGYSTMDNWTRVQATGTYSAPDYVVQLLEKAGYTPPTTEGTGRQSFPGLNMKAAEDLTPYGYRVSDEEARNILESYAPEAKGDPAKITAERVESKHQSAPMTVAAYNKLTPDQRAAVDFNTALIEAREKDINGGWMIKVPSKDSGAAEFRKTIFGEDAPTGGNPENVLTLLERIGYKAPGSKLEDFLSLDMAITAEELADLKLPKDISFATGGKAAPVQEREKNPFTGKPDESPFDQVAADDYGKVRSSENLGMIQLDVIRRASELLAQARASGSAGSWSPAATASNFLGVSPRAESVPFGWGADRGSFGDPKDSSKDGNFRMILEVLQNDQSKTKLTDSQAFWEKLKATGYGEQDIDQLFQFIDQRTRWMLENGVKPLEGQNDATIIRELAGLGPAQ